MLYSPHFRLEHPITLTYPEQLQEQIDASMEVLEERMSIFAQAGSGWTLHENHALILEMDTYEPLQGSSYIELPKDIHDTKAVVNIKNDDQQCFKWFILAALHPASNHVERLTNYQDYKDELNFDGIEFPVPIHQISKFEKQNSGISITVIGIKKKKKKEVQNTRKEGEKKTNKMFTLMSMRVPDNKLQNHVSLLYWKKGDTEHYAWVKNFDRLLSRVNKHNEQTYFCERCFQGFTRPDLLEKHQEMCRHFPAQVPKTVDQEIKFTSWAKTEPTLFRLYGDFESILKEIETTNGIGKTKKTQKHIPCSFAWVLISDHPAVDSRTKLYRPTPTPDMSVEEVGERVVDELITSLQELEGELKPFLAEMKPMDLTEEREAEFQAATHCYMCGQPFPAASYETEPADGTPEEAEKKLRVRKGCDHNHATGEYRGAAHAGCNINKRRLKHIPIFFHNLRGYDGHLIVCGIHRHSGKKANKKNKAENRCKSTRVIPNNMERHVSFQLGNLRFLDSIQFFGPGSSLDTSASTLNNFPILEEMFSQVWDVTPEELELLCKKWVYPYSYMDNSNKFNERTLPPKEDFYHDLTKEDISKEKYEFAQTVWGTMGCETLGDYHDIYLYQDILLLADVFEQFRHVCLKKYDSDPAHYNTVPGLAWDASLKITGVKLRTLRDKEMHMFLERGMRGGISTITHRYARANKYLKDYDPEQPNSFNIYYDANNLYGWTMSQPLPI